jgi:prepilin-type processing-associated H-X9-DG protein
MKLALTLSAVAVVAASSSPASAAGAFYGDPPDDHHPWAIHDMNRPQPKVVTPGSFSTPEQPGKPPSDAIVLFDGTDLSKWKSSKDGGGPAKWLVKDGYMEVVKSAGDIQTIEEFGDCQLHVEWAAPAKVEGTGQGRGNSGVFLMGRCEVQVLDSYNNVTYADGHAASVYGVNPPLANALHPPGQFQVYDIVFRRPVFRDGKALDPGHVTVFVNGVLVQDSTQLEGGTGHMKRTRPESLGDKGPLKLQDHGNPVRFRNIWYRPLPPRAVEGGTDGPLSVEATMAKRKELAAMIRSDAEKLSTTGNPPPKLMRLMESLEYEADAATLGTVTQMASDCVQGIKRLSKADLAPKKDEVKQVFGAFDFLTRFKLLPAGFPPRAELEAIIKEQRWDKK